MSLEFEHVEYGPYKNSIWYKAKTIQDKIIQTILNRIKNEVNTDGYSFYIYGGILEDWETKDLDMIFVGPYDNTRVRDILTKVTEISFEEKFTIDVRYQFESKIFDFQEWTKGDTELAEIYSHAILYDKIKCNGKIVNYDGYWRDDLFVLTFQQPMDKQILNYKERNLVYKSPYKII